MYAKTYSSGRFTGELRDAPVYQDNGDIAPNWVYVGDRSEAQFWAEYKAQEHGACHSANRADSTCEHCQAAGWVD